MENDTLLFTSVEAAEIFDALGHARRIRLIRILTNSKKPMSFGEIQTVMKCSNQVLTHHLNKLEQGSLLRREIKGRRTFFKVTPERTTHLFTKFGQILEA